jgi:hypothetical protein
MLLSLASAAKASAFYKSQLKLNRLILRIKVTATPGTLALRSFSEVEPVS